MATKDFIDYSPVSGNDNGQINITVPINPEKIQRNSSLSVTGGGLQNLLI